MNNSTRTNVAIVDMFGSHLRQTNTIDAVERYRMLRLLWVVREDAQAGDEIPSATDLYSATTADELLQLIADVSGETVEHEGEMAFGQYVDRETAARAIVSDSRSNTVWHSDDLRERAMSTNSPDAIEALVEANRHIVIANNLMK